MQRLKAWLFFHRHLRAMPPSVARFYRRARRHAIRTNDPDALVSATMPWQVAELLRRARPYGEVVEIGTSVGWMSIAFALNNPACRVTSYDITMHPSREAYLAMVPAEVRARITHVLGRGDQPTGPDRADFVFIDGDHSREAAASDFAAWRPRTTPGGTVAFHDYEMSGVRDAIAQLGLEGEATHGMFFWTPREDGFTPAGRTGV